MKKSFIPPTINLHSLTPCNYNCGFCYAGFATAKRRQIPQAELHEIIRQISTASSSATIVRRKVTFAGGEPLLSSTAIEDIEFARSLGLITSLVTNGSLLTENKILELGPVLDWLTISIDSVEAKTNQRIGRTARGVAISAEEYLAKIRLAQAVGIKVKVNTVVSQANVCEDFNDFIRAARPRRWKLFQVTRIAEENGASFGDWAITEPMFNDFLGRHTSLSQEGVVIVPEKQSDIYGSYAMVGPNGCFFDNSKGTYVYSRPIASVGIEAAWEEISFSLDRFRTRNGDYDFNTGLNRKG